MKIVMTILAVIIMSACVVAFAMENFEAPKSCKICRMDRTMFARTRILLIYSDGVTAGFCSIHCASEEMMNHSNKPIKAVLVADYFTKELIDAKSAVWVVGGKNRGVMTALPKWAFAKGENAHRFIKENGGIVNSFDQVINSATKEVMDQAAEEKDVENEILHERQQ